LHAGTILEHAFGDEFRDLVEVLGAIEPPLRESGPFTDTGRPKKPKRQRVPITGQHKYLLMPVDHPTLNLQLATELRMRGWNTQPIATTGLTVPDTIGPLSLKGDFVKNTVFVEVEFGNVASMFRDFFKFQIANRSRAGNVAVLVTGTRQMMKFADQGQATYETAARLVPYLSIGIQMPIWIVGIEPDDWNPIKTRYEEMRDVASANGVDCYDFETAHGAEIEVEVPPESGVQN
jgi:hypothetical protein